MSHLFRASLLAILALATVGCGGGGGGGGGAGPVETFPVDEPDPLKTTPEIEPNDDVATATPLPATTGGVGSVAVAGDADHWSFDLAAGDVISIELFGVRADQVSWNAASNVPTLLLLAPDGSTPLLEHRFYGFWNFSRQDQDVPMFRAPATGAYCLRIGQDKPADPGGAYIVRVTPLPVGALQIETEPDDQFTSAQPIVPGLVFGHHDNSNYDFYSFTIPGPSVVTFEMVGYRNGLFGGESEYYNPRLQLLEPNGSQVILYNDNSYFRDSTVSMARAMQGTYYLQVMQSGSTSGSADYFLKFELTPVVPLESNSNNTPAEADPISYGVTGNGYLPTSSDVDYFSFTGTAGDMVRLTVWDNKAMEGATKDIATAILAPDGSTVLPSLYTNGAGLQVRRTILTSSGTHYVRASNSDNTPYVLKLEAFKSAGFEVEPNDTAGTAGTLDGGGRASGVIGSSVDLDLYSFTATTGDLVTFSVYARASKGSDGHAAFSGYGSTLEPLARILDGTGAELASVEYSPAGDHSFAESVTNGLATLEVTFVAPADGLYYVEISDEKTSSSATHFYIVEKR